MVKSRPTPRLTNQATSRASPALHRAKALEAQMVRSLVRLAMMVAALTPMTTDHRTTPTGHRTSRPRAIRMPEETPAAGQNTATPSGSVCRKRLRRAAKKYAAQIATVSPIEASHHCLGLAFSEVKNCACRGTSSMSRLSLDIIGAENLVKPCSIPATSARKRADVLLIC